MNYRNESTEQIRGRKEKKAVTAAIIVSYVFTFSRFSMFSRFFFDNTQSNFQQGGLTSVAWLRARPPRKILPGGTKTVTPAPHAGPQSPIVSGVFGGGQNDCKLMFYVLNVFFQFSDFGGGKTD